MRENHSSNACIHAFFWGNRAGISDAKGKRESQRMKTRSESKAFTLIELLVLVACGLAVGFVMLEVPRRQRCGCRMNCVNNLKQIGLSFRTWALDNQDRYPMAVPVTNGGSMEFIPTGVAWAHFSVMSNELSTPKVLICPQDVPRRAVPPVIARAPVSAMRTTATTFGLTPRSGQVPFASDTNLSYFVGVDADEKHPRMLLAGDWNVAVGPMQLRP